MTSKIGNQSDIPLKHAMICWNPNGNARVFDHPVPPNSLANNYDMSDGACRVSIWQEMNDTERLFCLMTIFHTMTVGDEVAPIVAHRSLWVIPEYRAHISLDIRGQAEPSRNAPNAEIDRYRYTDIEGGANA